MDNTTNNRDHDGFFKYVYSTPQNARSLLELCSKNNGNLRQLLEDIDLTSLQQLPSTYNNVGERGEADVAFKAKAAGKDVFVGLLLEHKSYDDNAVIDQIGRYMFNVMVNKNDTDFRWLPSKAIIIYNGRKDWDPLANFRSKERAKFQGHDLPFECVLVNLADVSDEDIAASENSESSLGALIMKYAFDAKALETRLSMVETLLGKMPSNLRYLTLEKIKVYLGEYISKECLMEMEETFVSIGQRLGFVSAGDAHRAEVRQLKTDLAAKDARIKELEAQLEAQIAAKTK